MPENKSKVLYSAEIGEVPTYQIVAVRKDSSKIVNYQLNDGTVIDSGQAITMCDSGMLPGYMTGTAKDGSMYIRGVADGDSSNNLDSLPMF